MLLFGKKETIVKTNDTFAQNSTHTILKLKRSVSEPLPSIDAPNDTTVSKQLDFFKPIRNQCAYAIDNRVSHEMQEILASKRSQMGKLARKNHPDFGIGGGILISQSHMLVTKHCFETQDMAGFTVQFEYLNSAVYDIKRIVSNNEMEKLGLLAGENSDLIIIELKPNEHGFPGKNHNFTALHRPKNNKPAMLHFMGYTSGTKLKESTMPGRPIELIDVIERKKDVVRQHATWNDFGTHGDIISQSPKKSMTSLRIQSPAKVHEFSVDNEDIIRKNGTIANKINEFYVLYPHIFSHDHVRLAHRTKSGSSGGIYFTEDGEIFAVHCGRIPSKKYYPEHIAFYPWTKNTTTIYEGIVIYETKPISLAKFIEEYLNNFEQNRYTFYLNDDPIGYVFAINKQTDGRHFMINPFDKNNPGFSFVIPYQKDGSQICINGQNYQRKQLTFNYSNYSLTPHQETTDVVLKALYRVALSDLLAGTATNEIPVDEQQELGKRINNKNLIKHSMTKNNIRFEHTTLGFAQQKGSHYEFVRENNDTVIAIHAIGCHQKNTTYAISQCSSTFENYAVENNLWTPANTLKPQAIFRLK